MDYKTFVCGLMTFAGILVVVPEQAWASKSNDITYSDILDWTDDHIIQHRLSRQESPLTINDLKTKVRSEKMRNSEMSRTCVEHALHRCDIASMAKLLLPDDSPCTLFKEYQRCVYHETRKCNSGDARLLTTALDSLLVGLRSNGHCVAITTHTNADTILTGSRPSRPCGRRGVWMCTTALVEDLRSADHTGCSSLANYRHCIHKGTQPCSRQPSDALLRGTKGLARLYRKLTKQC